MKSKQVKSASDLEAQWQKEEDEKRQKEEEDKKKEEEMKRKEEEKKVINHLLVHLDQRSR